MVTAYVEGTEFVLGVSEAGAELCPTTGLFGRLRTTFVHQRVERGVDS